MGKKKTVQINEELFSRLYAYHILGRRDADNVREIEIGLQERADRMVLRKQYAEEHGLLTK